MTLKKFSFKVLKEDHHARLGKIITHRGAIDTPVFMPVGTKATIKGAFINDILKTKSQIILSNTYHLMIRPGVNRIKSLGGLHQYMNCKLPILTDSGGFQVMSLSKLNKVDKEKGAIFKSHIDGKKFILSPEESIKIQKGLNSDIVMVMDECLKKNNDYEKIKNSVDTTTYWAKRSKKAFGKNPKKALFGIVQGGLFNDLRKKSLSELIKINFDGYAIGGLAVGETQNEMFKVLKPAGRAIVLEFSHPVVPGLKTIYDAYSFTALPLMGKIICNDSQSYKYLAESIRKHPDQETLKSMFEKAGFSRVSYENLTGGVVALHIGYKL